MAATLSGTYTSAPDTPSPVFPDRLIRPLPKRPIRSRLSPEVAGSILYPPAPPVTRLFYGTHTGNSEAVNDAKVYVQQTGYGYEHSPERDLHHPYEDGVDSGEEDGPVVVRRSIGLNRSSSSPTSGDSRQKYAKHVGPPSTKSAASGPDGYDAFENTNNKKKRKIPTSGSLGSHSGLSTDLANLGLSGGGDVNAVALDDGSGTGSYYGSGNPASPAGNGISGSAKGRYPRSGSVRTPNGRAPLSAHSPNTWPGGRPGVGRRDGGQPPGQDPAEESVKGSDQGIISAAIANAANLSASAPPAQENTSLLDQTKKPAPSKTQFTFTCESDSSKGMAWQTQQSYAMQQHSRAAAQPLSAPIHGQRGFSTQGTQTSPNMPAHGNTHGQGEGGQVPAQGKKPRRSARSLYALAARQRRIQQQYTNLHHPPNPEDIWICEFCEYESIFGHPPEALIRQYEIKDRKERRRLAEKRRLLEKAKMKGRKGKKATKNAAKNAAAQPPSHQQGYDRQPNLDQPGINHENLDDDYLDDEYDDEIPPLHPMQSGPPTHPPAPVHNHANAKPSAGQPGRAPTGGGTTRPY